MYEPEPEPNVAQSAQDGAQEPQEPELPAVICVDECAPLTPEQWETLTNRMRVPSPPF